MRQSNIQNIRYVVSADDTEEKYTQISFNEKHEDFMLVLKLKSLQIDYGSLYANENAEKFASFNNQSLFVMSGESEIWKTSVHFTEVNQFFQVEEIMHTYTTTYIKLMEIKAALIHNNYKNCEFSICPTREFFEMINVYKLGKMGNTLTEDMKYFIDYEY